MNAPVVFYWYMCVWLIRVRSLYNYIKRYGNCTVVRYKQTNNHVRASPGPASVASVIGALALDGPHELPLPARFTAPKAQGSHMLPVWGLKGGSRYFARGYLGAVPVPKLEKHAK